MAVKVTDAGLKVGRKEVPLVLGAMHYWRLERKLWSEILDKVAGMGFEMIDTYIPWSVHEISKGKFDFGEKNPDNDIDTFLTLCAEKNIHVLVRPGPHINSELTYFGYPERVLADTECQAVSAQGSPVILPVPPRAFPAPSYASEKFYEETAVWFDAICPIIKKHLHPKGAVVAIQADNECSFFLRTSAYDLDYSEGSKKLFHSFLGEKYEDVDSMNDAYRSTYSGFDKVEMPRRFDAREKEDIPRYLDWAEYKEYYLIYALSRVRDMFVERGIKGIPVTHNYPAMDMISPFNTPATERELDIQGFDMYPSRRDYGTLKRGCLAASAQSRLPFIPEFSSGCWPWFPPVTFEDQRFTTLVAFMHGIRAISYYMLVERERWYGSPIARDGRFRQPNYDFYKKFNEIIKKTGLLKLEHDAQVLLTKSRSYQRLESVSTLVEPATTLFLRMFGVHAESECSEETFGFEEPVQIAADKYCRLWYSELEAMKYPFAIGDTDMDVKAMSRYALQIVPSYEFMGRDEQERLLEYAKKGGMLILGPRLPELDEQMKPCAILKKALKGKGEKFEGYLEARIFKVGKGRIVVTNGLPEEEVCRACAVEATAMLPGKIRPIVTSDKVIEISYHTSADGKNGVLFVANPTDKSRKADMIFDGKLKFENLWTGEEIEENGFVDFEVPPYTVTMLEVRK